MPPKPESLLLSTSQDLWAGTLESQQQYLAAQEHWSKQSPLSMGTVVGGAILGASDDDEEPKSRLLSVENGIGIITLHGSFVSEDNWWNKYAGLISYNEIRQAAHEAMLNTGIREVIVDVACPGGAVAGIFDAAEALRALGKMKRTTGYTDSTATSGGFWMLATTKNRYAAPIAALGSIGVVYPFMEYSKLLADEGINAKVFRYGEHKALGHPIEALNKAAEEDIQARIDHVGGVFVGAMAEYLQMSDEVIKGTQARVFIGSQAVDAGLIDGVSNFDKVYATVVTRVAKQGDSPMKKKFTAASLEAAAANGAISAEALVEAKALLAASEDGTVELDVAEPVAPEAPEEGADLEPAADAVPEAPEVPAEGAEALALVKEELTASQNEATEARAAQVVAEDALAALQAVVAPMQAIVTASIGNMLVALEAPAEAELADADAATVLARYNDVAPKFTESFKVGGVASTEPEDAEPAPAEAKAEVVDIHSVALKCQRAGLKKKYNAPVGDSSK